MNTVVAELRGEGDGLKARVYVVRDSNMAGGARELSVPTRDCSELMAAVALALSIAIDPDALDRFEQPEPRTTPTEDAMASKVEAPDSDERRSETKIAQNLDTAPNDAAAPLGTDKAAAKGKEISSNRTNLVEGRFGVFGMAASGPAPSVSFGSGVMAGIVIGRHWLATLEPEWSARSSKSIPENPSFGIRVGGLGGSFQIGYEADKASIGTLIGVQRLASEGFGVTRPNSDRSWWAGAGVRASYGLQLLGALRLVPRVDVLISLNAINFRIAMQSVHDTPAVLARVGAGLETRF